VSIIHEDLFKKVLQQPAGRGGDKLCAVVGYATAAMAYRHFEELPSSVSMDLVVGMSPSEGIGRGDHRSFQKLASIDYPERFSCRYLEHPPSVHAKVYVWLSGGKPLEGYVGSANYTQRAFFSGGREESLVPHDAGDCFDYCRRFLRVGVDCADPAVQEKIRIHEGRRPPAKGLYPERSPARRAAKSVEVPQDRECVTIPLLDRSQELPDRSGLNWGQRPEYRRDRDQAYIRVPTEIARSGFFPPRGTHFTLATDDGESLDCVIRQDNAKAIHSRPSNALIGQYFRKRLGLPSGVLIRKKHLLGYGRTDVSICRVDDENYVLDFSVSRSSGVSQGDSSSQCVPR